MSCSSGHRMPPGSSGRAWWPWRGGQPLTLGGPPFLLLLPLLFTGSQGTSPQQPSPARPSRVGPALSTPGTLQAPLSLLGVCVSTGRETGERALASPLGPPGLHTEPVISCHAKDTQDRLSPAGT